MKLGLLSLASLAICMGCSNAPYHPFTNDGGDEGSTEAGEDAGVDAPSYPIGIYCCKQAEVEQPCTLNPNPWTCVPFPKTQPQYAYDCTTVLCSAEDSLGLYCIGINGPGVVELCQ